MKKRFKDMTREELLVWFDAPIEFEEIARTQPFRFLRDCASLPTTATNPYYTDIDKFMISMTRGRFNLYDPEKDLFDTTFRIGRNDNFARFIHIDLARKNNWAALAMSHVSEFVDRKDDKGNLIKAPVIKVDCFMHIKPPEIGDIRFEIFIDAIEELSNRGFYIKLITFDQYQSAMPIDILRDKGYACDVMSIDKMSYWVKYSPDKVPYRVAHISTEKDYSHGHHLLNEIVMDNRFDMPYSERFIEEVKKVEEDAITKLISTPTGEPDDLLQAVIGSVVSAWHNEKPVSIDDENQEMSEEIKAKLMREQRIFQENMGKNTNSIDDRLKRDFNDSRFL